MLNDIVSDFLTRVRNSLMAKKTILKVFYSNFIYNILLVMKSKNLINSFDKIKEDNKFYIVIYLKYDSEGNSVIDGIKKISKPGLRVYCKFSDLKRNKNKLGFSIISTNKGVMSDEQAYSNKLGGEIICNVW